MELAALSAEAGMEVELHEAEDELGGQLRYVVRGARGTRGTPATSTGSAAGSATAGVAVEHRVAR